MPCFDHTLIVFMVHFTVLCVGDHYTSSKGENAIYLAKKKKSVTRGVTDLYLA